MPTPAERQALLFVAAVAALGVGVRGCRALRPDVPAASDRAALAAQIAAVDSAVTAGGERRAATARGGRPTRAKAKGQGDSRDRLVPAAVPPRVTVPSAPEMPRGPVDVDVAGVAELDRLPGIGPALAARIVTDREARGSFGSLRALERVRGIGPSLAAKLGPHVTFSIPPRPSDTEVPLRERVIRP